MSFSNACCCAIELTVGGARLWPWAWCWGEVKCVTELELRLRSPLRWIVRVCDTYRGELQCESRKHVPIAQVALPPLGAAESHAALLGRLDRALAPHLRQLRVAAGRKALREQLRRGVEFERGSRRVRPQVVRVHAENGADGRGGLHGVAEV